MTSAAPPHVDVVPAGPQHAAGLSQLFASNGFGCYCRYWHYPGDSRQWLERCFSRPEENEREMRAALLSGSPEMSGVVAQAGPGDVVGWLKIAPAASLGKLYDQRLYKGLPCFQNQPEGTWTVGCLLVRSDQRRRGVARALLDGAIRFARASGARAVEAFPRSDLEVADAALMLGPVALFRRAGFEVVHDMHPYPVLRLLLPTPPVPAAHA